LSPLLVEERTMFLRKSKTYCFDPLQSPYNFLLKDRKPSEYYRPLTKNKYMAVFRLLPELKVRHHSNHDKIFGFPPSKKRIMAQIYHIKTALCHLQSALL